MKKSISLIVILGALLLGAYYAVGVITESTLKKNISTLDRSNELSVSIENYKRRWFKSTALLHWQIHVPSHTLSDQNGHTFNVPAENYDVSMPLMINHGPIIVAKGRIQFGLAAANAKLSMPQGLQEKFAKEFTANPTKPEADLQIFINYLNQTALSINVPAFQMTAKESAQQFVWQGLNNDIHLSADFRHVVGKLLLSGMDLAKDDVHLMLKQLNTDYDLHQTDIGLFLGQADMSLDSVQMVNRQTKLFDLNQFNARSATDVIDGLFQSDIHLAFDSVFTNDRTYGPGTLNMSIKNIDAQALMDINTQLNKMQQGNDLEKQQAMLLLIPQIPRLLNKGAELTISELQLMLPQGKFYTALSLTLPKESINNPMEIVQKIKGQAKIEVPSAVVQALLIDAATEKLTKQSSIQAAVMQQMAKERVSHSANANAVSGAPTVSPDVSAGLKPENSTSADTSQTDIGAQAQALASQKIETMIKSGALVVQKDSFLIELHLENGNLVVNGRPFTGEMVPVI